MDLEVMKVKLMQEDPYFRSLVERHHAYDGELEQLEALRFPSEEEQLREVELKKLKLHAKDEIENRLHEFTKVAMH